MKKPKQIHWLSASKLKRFRACPYQSEHEPYQENAAMVFGKAFHSVLAAIHRGADPEEEWKTWAQKHGLTDDDRVRCIQAAENVVTDDRVACDPGEIVTVESEDGEQVLYGDRVFAVMMGDGWGLRGKMDRVICRGESIIITDWKSGMSTEDDDLQNAVYACVAPIKYPGLEVVTQYYYAEMRFLDQCQWTREAIAISEDYIRGLAERYITCKESDNWPRTPHRRCKWCGFRDTCPEFKKALETKPADVQAWALEAVPENFAAILTAYAKLETIAKAAESAAQQARDALLAIITCFGPQDVEGRTHDIKEKVTRYEPHEAAIIAAVQEQMTGIDVSKAMRLDLKKLETLAGELGIRGSKAKLEKIIKANRSVKSKCVQMIVRIAKTQVTRDEEAGNADDD